MTSRKKSILIPLVLVTSIILTSAFQVNNKYFEIARNLEIFTNIYKELNTHYVDDLDPNQLMRSGIDAMMNSLDPYTVFYSEAQVESYRISTEDRYNGLGADMKYIDGKVTVTEIFEGGAAQKAGLKVGDQIVRISGESSEGRSLEEVLQFVRGYPGTTLKLSTFRPLEEKTYDFTLTRSTVEIPNVPYSGMVSDNVGYIALTTFTPNAGKNIAAALRTLRDENDLQGLVLDLRDNGGGLLSEAVDILGIFLDQGSLVVSTKGKVRDRDQNYRTRRMPIDTELPLVVLVNKYSASASEIVSGAIQDYDRGVIAGQRTYGKGLVQNHHEVGYNSRIKVTTSKYYIPSGRCIQSVEYENGEPKDIEDIKREVFKTQNGRPVLDGGGVTPDLKLVKPDLPEIIKALEEGNWLFKYANHYVHHNKAVESLEEFSYNSFEDFVGFLEKAGFVYQTGLEKSIEEILRSSENEHFESVQNELKGIQQKLAKVKSDDLEQHRGLITEMIEEELVKRYFFQEGKTRYNLNKDAEIEEAIQLLTDATRYRGIIS